MKWGWGWDRDYTKTTEIVGSVRPGTLYYKYVRNYFKFNLRRESEVVKIKTMLILFWMTYSLFLWITKKKNVFLIFFLVVVFEVDGDSCFFVELKCSQFKILCNFQVYSNVICLYLCIYTYIYVYVHIYVCMYIYIFNIVPSGSSFKFEVISLF